MKALNKSNFRHDEVFRTCIETSRKHKEDYEKCLDILDAPESIFIELAEGSRVHEYSEDWNVFKKDIMVKLYDQKFVPLGSTAREKYYNKIMGLADEQICPICEHLTADTIDHFLPKSVFPSLAVVPVNLYPCCDFCNDEKDTFYAKTINEQIFNPYFDVITDIEWLEATLVKDSQFILKFSVKHDLDPILKSRLESFLKVYGLKRLYATQAVIYFNNNRFTYKTTFSVDGKEGLILELNKALASAKDYNKNSWTKVLIEALIKSDWFTSGEFIKIYSL